ncbi:hypothetical protein [Pseudomonas putida]|uniref:Uncharacterized protein n=1 Tax=Pseudomonas putida TaxID=303 RepID=A0A8I1JKU0_PSEPU|nr:hypothetical protein [Pseudomonas putida]MBI6885084.1 hypothetical protein [Pseudomonas putida]
MKTKYLIEKGRISLVIDNGVRGEKQVLAAMTLWEGTGVWSIVDIRLDKYATAHEYSGSGSADEFYGELTPKSEEERSRIKAMLHEYQELEDGRIIWCPMTSLVKGAYEIDGYAPPSPNGLRRAVHHTRDQGKAILKEIQAYWEAHEGTVAQAKIANPHAQPESDRIRNMFIFEEVKRMYPDDTGPGL